jgi:hypothetical protein
MTDALTTARRINNKKRRKLIAPNQATANAIKIKWHAQDRALARLISEIDEECETALAAVEEKYEKLRAEHDARREEYEDAWRNETESNTEQKFRALEKAWFIESEKIERNRVAEIEKINAIRI